jgi:chaperonin GroES
VYSSVAAEVAMKLRPLGDRIIVRRTEAAEKSAGGVIIPDAAQQKPQRGTVLAVGPGKLLKDGSRRPLQVREGDRVLFTAWAGDEFRERGSKDPILVMHEEDVLAVLG